MNKIESINQGVGEGSIEFTTIKDSPMSTQFKVIVDEIIEAEDPYIIVSGGAIITIKVYNGHLNGKLNFKIEANNHLRVNYE